MNVDGGAEGEPSVPAIALDTASVTSASTMSAWMMLDKSSPRGSVKSVTTKDSRDVKVSPTHGKSSRRASSRESARPAQSRTEKLKMQLASRELKINELKRLSDHRLTGSETKLRIYVEYFVVSKKL